MPAIGDIYYLMRKYELETLIDLGSGPGIIQAVLEAADIKVKGLEILDDLICEGDNLFGVRSYEKDLLELEITDIKGYQALYMWDPFNWPVPTKEFITRLVKYITPNQYIFCYGGANMCSYSLSNEPKLKCLENYRDIRVFQLK